MADILAEIHNRIAEKGIAWKGWTIEFLNYNGRILQFFLERESDTLNLDGDTYSPIRIPVQTRVTANVMPVKNEKDEYSIMLSWYMMPNHLEGDIIYFEDWEARCLQAGEIDRLLDRMLGECGSWKEAREVLQTKARITKTSVLGEKEQEQ